MDKDDPVLSWLVQARTESGSRPELSQDPVRQVNEIECTSLSLIKNKKIKKWCFYDQHKLCLFECHSDIKDDKIIKQKFYLNNMYVDVQELPSLNITHHISKLQIILKEHHEFISDVNKYLNKLSFNHSLKYGWRRKDLSFSLNVYKYKNIECILHFEQKENILNKEETLLFLKDHSYLFLISDPVSISNSVRAWNPTPFGPGQARIRQDQEDCVIYDFNTLSLNENPSGSFTSNINELVESVHNLNLKETIPKPVLTKRQGVKRNCDFLFINYPKWKRIEYQSCKKYDIEEIEFNNFNHDEEEEL